MPHSHFGMEPEPDERRHRVERLGIGEFLHQRAGLGAPRNRVSRGRAGLCFVIGFIHLVRVVRHAPGQFVPMTLGLRAVAVAVVGPRIDLVGRQEFSPSRGHALLGPGAAPAKAQPPLVTMASG